MSPTTRPATPAGIPTALSFSRSTSPSISRKPSIPLLSPSRVHLPASPIPSPALKSSPPSLLNSHSKAAYRFPHTKDTNHHTNTPTDSEADPDETAPFHFDDRDSLHNHEHDTISGKSTILSPTRHSRQSSSFTLDLDLSTIEADPPALHLPLVYGVDPAKTPLPDSPIKMQGDYIMSEVRAGPSHRSFSPTRLQQTGEGSYRPGEQRARPGRRPASAYATEEPGLSALPARKFTDPTPFSQYNASQKGHGLDLSAISHEFDDDSRAPTLSFVTTATADSTTSTPSLSNSYGGFRPDPMEHFKEATEPRMRIRAPTGRANAYSSAGSSGAYSGYGYADGMYDDAPPIPVIPPVYASMGDGSPLHPARAGSPSDSFRHRPWKSDLAPHFRADSDASSITSISEDQAQSGVEEEYHFDRYELSDRMPWEDEDEVAEPMAVMSLERVLDHARLQSMGGMAALTDEAIATLRGVTHLLLPGVGPSLIECLHLLLDTLASSLLVIDLSDNDLAFLPEALQRCTQLEELNLANNPLRKLPPFVGGLVNLRVAMLDGCALQGLPMEMAELRQMHTLCVRRNRLVSLPPFLCLLDRLEVLRIEENPFAAEWQRIVAPIISIPTTFNRPFSPHAGMAGGMREAVSTYSIASTATDASDGHGPPAGVQMQTMTSSLSTYQQPSLNPIAEDRNSFLSADAPRPSRDTQGTTDDELPLPQPSFAGRTVRKMRSAGSLLNLRASGTGSSSSVNATLPVSPPMTTSVSIGPSHSRRMSFANNRESVVPAEAAGMGLSSSTSRFGGKLGFLRKMSMKSLKPDKAATISASASANIQHLPPPLVHQSSEPGPSRPARPARPPLQNAFTASVLPTRSALGDVSEFGESPVQSRAASPAHATMPITGMEPTYRPLATASTSGKRAKRRSFLPIDPAPPSISVSIPPTSPFMPPVNGFRPPSVHALIAAQSESTIADQTFTQTLPLVERDPEAEKRYADGLNSIKSYLRDLYDLSRPLMAPYGGFAVMAGPTPTDSSYASSMADSERPNTPASGGLKSSISQRRRRPTLDTMGSRCVSSASVDPGSHFDQSFSQQYEEDALDGKKFKNDKGKRARVLREIYETERTYVRSLGELVQIYVRPSSAPVKSGNSETVIPAAERKVVFGGVESILSIHKENLLPALEQAVKPLLEDADDTDGTLSIATAHQVGSVFRTYIAYMKQYSTYINNFDNALSRMQAWDAASAPMVKGGSNVASLAALSVSGAAGSVGMSPSLTDGAPHSGNKMNTSQTKRVKAFLKAAKKHPLHSQINLESYLLLPVQRVPRYKLLLEDLAMCTPPLADSPRDTLDDALNEIASLASLMNEEKRDAESRLRLFYWQKRIASKGPSPLVQPHRKLIMDGSLQLIRLVKKASSYVEVDNTILGLGDGDATVMPSKAVVPVESIMIEPMNKSMILLLCSDLLVLAQPRAPEMGQESQVDLYHVMRMSTLKEPASANGNVLRVVDHKTIYYFVGTSTDDALQWSRAINTAHGR